MSNDSTEINLIDLLPEVYKTRDKDNHLNDFLQPISNISENIRKNISDWSKEFDIKTVIDDYLNHIGNLFGYKPRTHVPNLTGKRRKIRYVTDLWERKGTTRGYYLAGIEVDIPTHLFTDLRYSVLVASHQGRLSVSEEEAYLQDNLFHHEGVLEITTKQYLHPSIFFNVVTEFLPGGFMLYITQTIHQGFVMEIIIPEGEWHTQDSYWIREYLPKITAEPIWFDLTLDKEDVYLHFTYTLSDSIGYTNDRLPFDPQPQDVPLGYERPALYNGPFGPKTGRQIKLNELWYPRTDPKITQEEIIFDGTDVLDSTTVDWIETSSGATSLDPYVMLVSNDGRIDEHVHWMTEGIKGNMIENIVEYDGNNWVYANLSNRKYEIDKTDCISDSTDSTCIEISWVESSSGADATNPYIIIVVSDNRTNRTTPLGISGDMSGNIIEYYGSIIGWKYSFPPP